MGIKGLRCARRQTCGRTNEAGAGSPDGDAGGEGQKHLPEKYPRQDRSETGARKMLDSDKWREDGMRFLGDNMFSRGETTVENKSPLAVSWKSALTVIDEYRYFV